MNEQSDSTLVVAELLEFLKGKNEKEWKNYIVQ
jgi:hypothetical protein